MTTFSFPIPASIITNPNLAPRDIPSHIVAGIKKTWGGRAPLPAGGFDVLVTLPALTDNTRDDAHDPLARFIFQALRAAGVLETPPSVLGVRFVAGDVPGPEVVVTMIQLQWPDGTPAVLPRRETTCAC